MRVPMRRHQRMVRHEICREGEHWVKLVIATVIGAVFLFTHDWWISGLWIALAYIDAIDIRDHQKEREIHERPTN